jgi:hypothetical protein
MNVKSPNNTSKWQMGFNSAFKELTKIVKIFVKFLNCHVTQSGAWRKENITRVDHSKKDQLGGKEYH